MKKNIGATLLVAGTCIGSGMIALPMVLAKLGIIPSILLMAFIWYIMYYTSLVNLELNLQANQGLSLGTLGRKFSGIKAELVGNISLKLLTYALLAVFIYGGSSVIQELLETKMDRSYSFNTLATSYALITVAILMLPMKWIDYMNRLLFIGLIVIFLILTAGLIMSIDWNDLPLFSTNYQDVSAWIALVPVVFTSFGFQVIFHTLTEYCNKNAKMLKQAFFWGSLIPAIVYIVWTCGILAVIYNKNPTLYQEMILDNVKIGTLVLELSYISNSKSVQLLIWWMTILAIGTSIIGVGTGLCDSIKTILSKRIKNSWIEQLLAVTLTIVPAYLAVILTPNAFITILGFAGMILAILAILQPIYLFGKIGKENLFYKELKSKILIRFSAIVALVVILSELYHLL